MITGQQDHRGHPFWRRDPNGRDYVVIGRNRQEECDEVWTWSRALVRDLRACLESEVIWSRAEWERDVCSRGRLFEHGRSVRCTMIPNGADETTGTAERVVDGWVAEGVLRRPTDEEVTAISQAESRTRVLTRSKDKWLVDELARDAWFAVRLLVMSDWGHAAWNKP